MEKNNNPQWPKGFPDVNDVRGGIFGGILYVVTCGNDVAAVFSAVGYDRDYDEIDGKWLTVGNYLAVHRVAVSEKYRGMGAAKYAVSAATEIARSRGRTSLRFDTHEKNIPMRSLLKSQNFTECGKVKIFRDDTERLAFEKII
jgi:ribosomal protein S18 acetylase RimI-like enzyme